MKAENFTKIESGPPFFVSGAHWSGNTVMERSFICNNGHPFRVFDKVEGPSDEIREIHFGVHCPLCGAICEIDWPSNRPFKIVAN